MSFHATVEVNGATFNLLNFHYKLSQETDATGRPSTVLRGGKARFSIESCADDEKISDLAFDSYTMSNFVVNFEKRDTKATAKKINFNDAYVVAYEENFDSTGKNPATITFTISARVVDTKNSEHENPWV
ncbi:type VI secretion system tube protein TssD [Aquimarina sp. RZ0]|uniref:type VI secretion system tube protein TssD n=1 Tax=Aquimarina sp. RZ0 TaxID=2607730 RepID=UPI0011F333E8|nr:type VI secretion system tube protein TssD [Aquimarina sp. RZ0]KAA1245325.1 phage tail protein [Aquimarina sp. RZ0]